MTCRRDFIDTALLILVFGFIALLWGNILVILTGIVFVVVEEDSNHV
jgi:hypothetical protein